MPPESGVVDQLASALEAVPRLKELARRSPDRVVGSQSFQRWREDAIGWLGDVFGKDSSQVKAFASIQYSPSNFYFGASDATFRAYYFRGLDVAAGILGSAIREANASVD